MWWSVLHNVCSAQMDYLCVTNLFFVTKVSVWCGQVDLCVVKCHFRVTSGEACQSRVSSGQFCHVCVYCQVGWELRRNMHLSYGQMDRPPTHTDRPHTQTDTQTDRYSAYMSLSVVTQFHCCWHFFNSQWTIGMSNLHPNWVSLAPNGTNLGSF